MPQLQAHWILFTTCCLISLPAHLAHAEDGTRDRGGDEARGGERANPVSPARRIERGEKPESRRRDHRGLSDAYSVDGSGNNPFDPALGAAEEPLLRLVEPAYSDGVASLAGAERPSARAVSNRVHSQEELTFNPYGASDYLWQWGQFLDHDIDLTDGVDPPEAADIDVPVGDPFFDPEAAGGATISLNRSLYDPASGTGTDTPRQQINEITAWIDGSNVYGSDEERATALRSLDGSGELKTSDGDLLPFNEEGLANAGGSSPTLFLAGDVRANEQVGLTAMHTLFVREHNYWAREFASRDTSLTGDELYEAARRRVIAEMQAITYGEFLPALLGRDALRPYRGYEPRTDARIANLFSTAAYRFGHSALSPTLLRLDAQGEEVAEGHLPLRDAFFSPQRLVDEGGIEPILRGLAAQTCQDVEVQVIDDVRNCLFGAPGSGGFDLASLNIQRGRDHGLPSYNEVREAFGLARALSFEELTSDAATALRLADAYEEVDDVDLWTGILAEDRYPGSHMGLLGQRILVDQFEALRDGDRFWFEAQFSRRALRHIKATTLATIIRRNTAIGDEIADDVFYVESASGK